MGEASAAARWTRWGLSPGPPHAERARCPYTTSPALALLFLPYLIHAPRTPQPATAAAGKAAPEPQPAAAALQPEISKRREGLEPTTSELKVLGALRWASAC